MALRTVTLKIIVNVGKAAGELAGSALVTSLLTNHDAIEKILVVEDAEGAAKEAEGEAWLAVHQH